MSDPPDCNPSDNGAHVGSHSVGQGSVDNDYSSFLGDKVLQWLIYPSDVLQVMDSVSWLGIHSYPYLVKGVQEKDQVQIQLQEII